MRSLRLLPALALLALSACGHPHLQPKASLGPAAQTELGSRWYRMELSSGQRIGFMHLKIEDAAGEAKAAYRVTTEGVFAMGPVEMQITERSLLDASFSAVSVKSEKNQQLPDQPAMKESSLMQRAGKGWDRKLKGKDDHAPLDVPYFDVTPGVALLVERLPLTDGAKWSLPSLLWTDRMKGEQAKQRTITLEVRAAKFQHDGKEVVGYTVTVTKDDKPGEDVLHVDASGRMLRLTTSDAPIRLIATTEELARKEDAPQVIDPGSPQYPLTRYLEVLAGLAEPDALDEVLDWDAILADMSEKLGQPPTTPEAREATIASIKAELHGKAAEKLDAKMIQLAVGMTSVEMRGEQALLSGPGGGAQVFVVEKRGERWVLVELPR
ncbi:MAG: hypothetical protein P1V51_05420 [Deltaproteobacteria bacterium]|nr:hypothetical protein [Deltaproteobacteria bacterium]